jgi:hypothetical protein
MTQNDQSSDGTERNNLSEYTIAPQHGTDLSELEPYIIEGVAYSPLKMTFLSSSHDETLELRCDTCEWTTTVGELPRDSGYVQPDMCPDCAKNGELGFVRCQSPADGTFPSGWNDRNTRSETTGSERSDADQ